MKQMRLNRPIRPQELMTIIKKVQLGSPAVNIWWGHSNTIIDVKWPDQQLNCQVIPALTRSHYEELAKIAGEGNIVHAYGEPPKRFPGPIGRLCRDLWGSNWKSRFKRILTLTGVVGGTLWSCVEFGNPVAWADRVLVLSGLYLAVFGLYSASSKAFVESQQQARGLHWDNDQDDKTVLSWVILSIAFAFLAAAVGASSQNDSTMVPPVGFRLWVSSAAAALSCGALALPILDIIDFFVHRQITYHQMSSHLADTEALEEEPNEQPTDQDDPEPPDKI